MKNAIYEISDFKKLSLQNKYRFFDFEFEANINSVDSKELNRLFRGIILDDSENDNIRKRALQLFIDCALLERIKVRQVLSLLLDDWNDNADIFLKIQRLKELFLFYAEEEGEIEALCQSCVEDQEAELASEAQHNLGLIYMQKGLIAQSRNDSLDLLKESEDNFLQAITIIENRIDSQFFRIVVSILINIWNGKGGIAEGALREMASLLFKQDAFSSNFEPNFLYLGFYRILNSIYILANEKPQGWLDIRSGLNRVFVQYSEINNQALKDRLNESSLSGSFIRMIKRQFLEPFYSLHFTSQIAKIDSYLEELTSESREYRFYKGVKLFLLSQPRQQEERKTIIKRELVSMFPYRNESAIESSISKGDIESHPENIIHIIYDLQKPSMDEFIDKLVDACLKLQGNRIYRGSCFEDDRNTYIADLLETSGYGVKDQTRWSVSEKGKSAGEIDIFVKDSKGYPFSIIEALNLNSMQRDYTVRHLDKLFKYDTSGLDNIILVYSTAANFNQLWLKYKECISEHNYEYKFRSLKELERYPFTEIKLAKAEHLRNGTVVLLYHLMINLN